MTNADFVGAVFPSLTGEALVAVCSRTVDHGRHDQSGGLTRIKSKQQLRFDEARTRRIVEIVKVYRHVMVEKIGGSRYGQA
ncbi:MAG TPA: hypothetical protein DEF07_00865 [Nitrosomonas sp.]|nr:hypothetical protein [Nitrosomonas sp.]